MYDAGPLASASNTFWDSLTWEATTPTGTSVEFQIYVGDNGDLTQAVYVGPDGTTSTYLHHLRTSFPSGTAGRYASLPSVPQRYRLCDANAESGKHAYNVASTNGSSTVGYGYDAANNMVSKVTEALGADIVTENPHHQCVEPDYSERCGGRERDHHLDYTFDNNGNTLSKSNGTDTWSYQWNDENRLVLVTLPDSSTVAYTWDMFGRMLTRTDASGTTRFVWDGFQLWQETDYLGNVSRYYIPSDRLLSFDRGGSVYQVHADCTWISSSRDRLYGFRRGYV